MANIIVKKYEHYNRSLGMHISNKHQYYDELKKRNFIPLEEAKRISENRQDKKWTPSKDCVDVVKELYDKKGKDIKLSDYPQIVDKMKEKGITFDTKKIAEMTGEK